MSAKQQPLEASQNAIAKNAWADSASISENPGKKGIELHFNKQPSPNLKSRLRTLGFRPSRLQTMWYGPDTAENKTYANDLVNILPEDANGPGLELKPSFEPTKTNVEKRDFSFVHISLKNGQKKNYLVFEPSKPKAEVIATAFAQQKFGKDFVALSVQPKTHVREARLLLEERKIISGEAPTLKPEIKMQKNDSAEKERTQFTKIALKEVLLTPIAQGRDPDFSKGQVFPNWRDADNYSKSQIGKYPDVYFKIQWEDNSTHSGWIDLEPANAFEGKQDILSDHVQKYFKFLAQASPNVIYSTKAIKEAQERLNSYQLKDDEASHGKREHSSDRLEPFKILNSFHDWLKAHDKDIYEDPVTKEDFNSWLKDSGLPLDEQQQADALNHHEAFVKAVIKMHTKINGVPKMEPYTSIYRKLLKVIPGLLEHLKAGTPHGKSTVEPNGGLMALNYDFLGKDKDGNYVIALAHNYVQEGDVMADPDMQIRVIPAMEAAEALTFQQSNPAVFQQVYMEKEGKQLVDLKLKKQLNSFLNQWLGNVLHQGHTIDLSTEERESAENSAEENRDVFQKAFSLLKELVPGIMPFLEEIRHNPEMTRDLPALIDGDKRIHLLFENDLKDSCDLLIEDYNANSKDLSDSVRIYFDKEEAHVTAEWLSNKYARKYDRLESQEEIEDDDRDIGEEMSRAFVEWLEDIIKVGYKIALKAASTSPSLNSTKAIPIDIKSGDTDVANVLVPNDLKEPFLSDRFFEYDMKKLVRNSLPELFRLTNDNLAEAKPVEMLQLLKLSHPGEYDINVSRVALLKEWEKRGKEIFEALGFPTNFDYPYVNINLAYQSVETLRQILADSLTGLGEPTEWWSVAQNYFPIANMEKALNIIESSIKNLEKQKESFINPKTKKPKQADLIAFRDLDFKIKDLKSGKNIIQKYSEAIQDASSSPDPDSDPLANEHGVYTEKSAGENYEKIIIPTPKSAQFIAEIFIAKTSAGFFTFGIDSSKNFGDANGMGFQPSIEGEQFPSRNVALAAALKLQEERLLSLIDQKDHILNNEEKKNKNLNAALKSVRQFATEKGIELDGEDNSPETELKAAPDNTFVSGLEKAYWTRADDEYPVNKITINGMEFNQARLRQGLLNKLATLSIEDELQIAEEFKSRFSERRPIEEYYKFPGTSRKKEKSVTKHAIAEYMDDIMLDNGILDSSKKGAIEFLFITLFGSAEQLSDLPTDTKVTVTAPEKKLNPHDLNKAIEKLITDKDEGGRSFSAEEKIYIQQYTGSGGLIKQGASGRGVLYEYYTPDIVVHKMWDLAYKYGYAGGSVLEPAVGTGNFLKYAPKNAAVFGFETNHYSARIAQVIYPNAHIYEKAFESLFFAGNIHLKDKFDHVPFNLVIGNPPYGDFTGKYAGMGEKKWTGALEYHEYFIVRGLDVLTTDGLLVFIIPSSFLDSQSKSVKVKEKIATMARIQTAYRLPNGIFDRTDIGTDILVLKKIAQKSE